MRIGVIDVRDRADMTKWIAAFDRMSPVDLVFANAGVMEGTRPVARSSRADAPMP